MTAEHQLTEALQEAVKFFWQMRQEQGTRQGTATGVRDAGSRKDVTGGAHMGGFALLVRDLLVSAGLPEAEVCIKKPTLPGYFRPTKQWDLVATSGQHLVAIIEFKSQVGPSWSNNFNNRVEEALGSATDLWVAYKCGVFEPSQKPWVGYLVLVEDCEESREKPKREALCGYYEVVERLRRASFIEKYENFCRELVRERLYDASCLLVSSRDGERTGAYSEPCAELDFGSFARSLYARARAFSAIPPQ